MTPYLYRPAGFGVVFAFACVAALLAPTSEAAAQTAPRPTPAVSFAVVGGLNAARLSLPLDLFLDETGVDVSGGTRIGFIGGLLIEVPATTGIAFDTGVLVSARGSAIDTTVPGFGTAKADLRMMYLDFPALVRVPLAASGNNRVHALAGATIGTKLHARARVSFAGESEEMTFTEDLPAMDVGITVGGRADFGRVLAIVTYTFGLTDTTKGDAPEPVKHRVLSIMGGWKF
jgi:hypothetical protein